MELQIKKLKDVKTPTRSYPNDAGMDLYAPEDITLNNTSQKTMKLGIAIQLPLGHVGLIQGKSGLASKHGLDTIGNVIDAGYTGEIGVTLVNNNYMTIIIKKGQKICQLLVVPVSYPKIVEVNKLIETDRGDNGFGSTGE